MPDPHDYPAVGMPLGDAFASPADGLTHFRSVFPKQLQ